MPDQSENNHDLLDQAIASLRETPIAQGPSQDLIARTLSRLEDEPDRSAFSWKILITKHRPMAAAAVLVVVSAVALMCFLPGSSNFAFGAVLEKVRTLSAVSYKMKGSIAFGNQPATNFTSNVIVQEPFKIRQVIEASHTIMIIDATSGRELMLNPDKKTAMEMTIKTSPKPQTAQVNILDQFRKFDSKDFQPIGEKMLNEQKLVGFTRNDSVGKMTVWVDSKTQLPVKMEIAGGGAMMPQGNYEITDIDWNPQIDETTFSTTPPADYRSSKMSMDMSGLNEQDVIDALRKFTENYRGSFPDTFGMSEMFKGIGTKASEFRIGGKAHATSQPTQAEVESIQESITKELLPIIRAMTFMMSPQYGSDWHYAGKGAKLNDANRPVLWYRPKDSQKYHVIDAQLKVSEVDADHLPRIPSVIVGLPTTQPVK